MVRRLCRVQFSIAGDASASAARDGPHSRPRRERRRSCPTPRSKQRARSTKDDFSASAPIALTANRLRAKQLRKLSYCFTAGDYINGVLPETNLSGWHLRERLREWRCRCTHVCTL